MPHIFDKNDGSLRFISVISPSGVVDRPAGELLTVLNDDEKESGDKFPTNRPVEELRKTAKDWIGKRITANNYEENGHPDSYITPENSDKFRVGHILDAGFASDKDFADGLERIFGDEGREFVAEFKEIPFLIGVLQIDDKKAIDELYDENSNELRAFATSPGVRAGTIRKDGENQGKKFQFEEFNIRPNHLALTNNPKWDSSHVFFDSKGNMEEKEDIGLAKDFSSIAQNPNYYKDLWEQMQKTKKHMMKENILTSAQFFYRKLQYELYAVPENKRKNAIISGVKWADAENFMEKAYSYLQKIISNYESSAKQDSKGEVNMPLPTPNKNETEQEFVARFMKGDYEKDKPQDQREAIAFSTFRGHEKSDAGHFASEEHKRKYIAQEEEQLAKMEKTRKDLLAKGKDAPAHLHIPSEWELDRQRLIIKQAKAASINKTQDTQQKEDNMPENEKDKQDNEPMGVSDKKKDAEDPNEQQTHNHQNKKLDEILALEKAEFDAYCDSMEPHHRQMMMDAYEAHQKKSDNQEVKKDNERDMEEEIKDATAASLAEEQEHAKDKFDAAERMDSLGIKVSRKLPINKFCDSAIDALKMGDDYKKLGTINKIKHIKENLGMLEKQEQERMDSAKNDNDIDMRFDSNSNKIVIDSAKANFMQSLRANHNK